VREKYCWLVADKPSEQGENCPTKPPDGKKWMVLILRWPRISGFEVGWSKSNLGNSWMVENGLYS
jgi:hypothetical protein